MNKQDVLKAFEQLDAADQQAVRTQLAEHAAAGCCGSNQMQQHMAEMMKMMQSSESPMECCKQMMEMCEEMMHKAQLGGDEAR